MDNQRQLAKYRETLSVKLGVTAVDEALLRAIVDEHGASFAGRDAALVACSDPAELEHLKRELLIGHYRLADGPGLDAAIAATCHQLADARATKYTGVFLYLVLQRLRQATRPRPAMLVSEAGTGGPGFDAVMLGLKRVKAPPIAFLQERLAAALKFADAGVHGTFHGDQQPVPWLVTAAAAHAAAFAGLAVNYAAYVLSLTTSYGFDRTVQGAGFETVAARIAALSPTAGRAMIIDYLADPSRLQFCFQNPTGWAWTIGAEAAKPGFLAELIVELQSDPSSASVLPAKLLLVLLAALDPDGAPLRSVLAAWQQSPCWKLVADHDAIPWFDTVELAFVQNQAGYGPLRDGVVQACAAPHLDHYTQQVIVSGDTGVDNAVQQHWTRTTYGVGVTSWLNSGDGPGSLGMRSGQGPDNVEEHLDDSGGCLIAGTQIRMADGRLVAVEHIREGDRILNGRGEVSVTSPERFHNPAVTFLYAINDDTPCMSAEHAIMTQRGWCSLDPPRSHALNPHLQVHLLRIGDVVWRRDQASQAVRLEVVKRVNIRRLPTGQGVSGYALHLREGHPSLWSNGYCSLIDYPEVTTQRIAANVLTDMSPTEEVALREHLDRHAPLFEKAFGKPLVAAARKLLTDPAASARGASHVDAAGRRRNRAPDASGITLPRLVAAPVDPRRPPGFGELSLVHGNLVIDGALVDSHARGDHVYWTRRRPNGTAEHGAITLTAARTQGAGVVRVGNQRMAFTISNEIDYATHYGNGATAWYTLAIGFDVGADGSRVPTGELRDADGNPIAAAQVVLTTQGGHLAADIEFSPAQVAFLGIPWIAATVVFSEDYSTFKGQLYRYDQTGAQNRGESLTLAGTCSNWQTMQQYSAALTAAHMARAPDPALLATATGDEATPPRFALAAALTDSVPLTVEALYSLPAPDPQQLHQNCFGTLKNLMLYALPDEQVAWFGEKKPEVGPGQPLSASEVKLLDDATIKSFFTDQFSVGYLTQAFIASSDPQIAGAYASVPDAADRLAYFWQGTGETCFPQLKGYNLASAQVLDLTYAAMVPGLQPYLDDTSTDWGQKLYLYCTQTKILEGLALQTTLDGQSRIQAVAMLLHALSPTATVKSASGKDVSYATALYEAVVNVRLDRVRQNFITTGNADDAAFLTGFLRLYFQQIQDGTGGWSDEVRQAALADMQATEAQFEVDHLDALMQHAGDAVSVLLTALQAATNMPLPLRLKHWADENPKIAGRIGGALTMAMLSLSCVTVISEFANWKQLRPDEQAQVVVNAVDFAATVFNKVAVYKAAATLTTPGLSLADAAPADLALETALAESQMIPIGDALAAASTGDAAAPLLQQAGGAAAEAISTTGSVEQAASRWASVAKISGYVAQGMAILAMAAACVATGFQISEDFRSGQPIAIEALDICEEIANGVCFFAAGAGAFALAGFEVCAAIPVVGAVAAIVGIIIAIVLLCIHRNPPPTPEETYVQDHCIRFLSTLAKPPDAWLQGRAAAQAHLNAPAPA